MSSVRKTLCKGIRLFFCVCRIVQRLGGWCKAETLLGTVPRPFLRREIRSLLIGITLLIKPELTTSLEMLRRRSGVCRCAVMLFFSSSNIFDLIGVLRWYSFSLRHLQREMENQRAQIDGFQQQMRNLDEDLKQNQELLRRTHTEQKTAEVTCLHLTNHYDYEIWNDV